MPRKALRPFLVPPPKQPIVSLARSQLDCVNQKIAELITRNPQGNVRDVFALAAHLAGEAIEAATELQQMPGIDVEGFRDALNFWHRVRDYNGTAALNCVGGNQTLAEALITFRLLRSIGE